MKEWLFKSTNQGGLLRKASMFFSILEARFMITKITERKK